jgi:hypothetical protein
MWKEVVLAGLRTSYKPILLTGDGKMVENLEIMSLSAEVIPDKF